MKFISSRITDNSVLRLVEKMLKAGILKNGEFYVNEFGAGQGGLCQARHKPPYDEIDVMPRYVQYS